MQNHDVELELQKRVMNADSLRALGLSTENALCGSSKAVSRPLKILFSYPTEKLARVAVDFFNGFTVIIRGQKVTFSASHLAYINQTGDNNAVNLNCSILLTEEHNSYHNSSTVDGEHTRSPTMRYKSSSIAQSIKKSTEINGDVFGVSGAKMQFSNRLSELNLSAQSPDLTQLRTTSAASIAESLCAPDTDTRYHIVISNIPANITSPDVILICRSQGFFPIEDAPVIFEANLETNSNKIYTIQRSMTISFSDLATAMLCKDFLNQYVVDQEDNVTLFAKLVDRLSEQKVLSKGVLVRHIPRIVKQDIFFSVMSSFGSILSCRFVRGTRTTTGFGAIIFETSEAAKAAKQHALIKLKEFTLQYIEARRVTKSQQESLLKSQSQHNESAGLKDPIIVNKPLKNSVSFGAVSYADPSIPPAIITSLSNNSEDSTTDVIRAVVEANNRLILSRKRETGETDAETVSLDPQINKIDLLYTAMHNHHLPNEFFRKYETLIRQAGTDDQLLSFLHHNAILHGATKQQRHQVITTTPLGNRYPIGLDNDIIKSNDVVLRHDLNCPGAIELDAKELSLNVSEEFTATTDP